MKKENAIVFPTDKEMRKKIQFGGFQSAVKIVKHILKNVENKAKRERCSFGCGN